MRHLFSLRGKMLLFTFGIVAVLTGLSLAVLHALVARQVQAQIGIELARTQSVFETFMRERADWLQAQCEVVAEDPRFTAPLDIQTPRFDDQARTVLREARRFQRIIKSDLFMVTNRDGQVLARLAIAPLQTNESLIARARELADGSGEWPYGDRVFQVVVAPGERDLLFVLGFSDGVARELIPADLRALAAADAIDSARWLMDAFDADLAAVIDSEEGTFDALVRQEGYGEDVSASPGIRDALSGVGSAGLQVERGQIVQQVITPVWVGRRVLGVLSAGFGVDDRLAQKLHHMTESNVSFGLNDHVVASTWAMDMRAVLNEHLKDIPDADAPILLNVGNEIHLSLLRPLSDLRGDIRGFYLLQLSYDQAIAFLSTAERVLIILGSAVLLVAAVLSFAGTGRITKPVQALVAGTRLAAAGHLDTRIDVTSSDEIGELAHAFNEMAAGLQRSLDALTTSERQYRDLFDNAQDMVYTADMNMRLTSLNKSALSLLGYAESDLLGKRFYDLLIPEDAQRLEAEDRRCTPGDPRPVVEVVLLCHNGQRAIEVVSRWMMAGDQPMGIHGIGRDIQARKDREAAAQRFREQLHQAEKLRALGEMAAGVAHNFNNLLTGVMGYAELMKMRNDVPDPVRANASKIVAAAQRCSAIVRRIQTFGKPIDISQTRLIDLNAVIRDTVDLARPRWKAAPEREGRKVEIALKLSDIPQVRSTASAWEEILSNLIFNAVDAMPGGGTISISTRTEAEQVVVVVADTGTGMDEDVRNRAFEPFFSTKGPERGTGLGLSTVWGLMQSLGGQIELDSAPGQGTRFTLRMPAAEGENPVDIRQPEQTRGLRILVIDDDPDVRGFLPDLLRTHHVDTATNGNEGLIQLQQTPYDAVMTDWTMAGLSGIEIAERVKMLSPKTVTILMTGWETANSAVEGHKAIDLIVAKPFDADELNRILTRAQQMIQRV